MLIERIIITLQKIIHDFINIFFQEVLGILEQAQADWKRSP